MLLILVVCSVACAQTDSPATSTIVWDLKTSLAPMTLGGEAGYVSGQGVQLAPNTTSGTVSFLGTDAPFPVDNVIASWNIDMPSNTGARLGTQSSERRHYYSLV